MLNLNTNDFGTEAQYLILNLLGSELAKGKLNSGIISVSSLPSGVFMLEVVSENKTALARLIKK